MPRDLSNIQFMHTSGIATKGKPSPPSVLNAFKYGFQTVESDRADGTYNFNTKPLLPLRNKQPAKNLFDLDKIKGSVDKIDELNGPEVKFCNICEENIENYFSAHQAHLEIGINEVAFRASLEKELNSSLTSRSYFSKLRSYVTTGYVKFDAEGFFEFLEPDAKQAIEAITTESSAINFYKTYGTHYVFQVGVGAYVQLSETIEQRRGITSRNIKSSLGAAMKNIAKLESGNSYHSYINNGYEDFQQIYNLSSIGGNHLLVDDQEEYIKAAKESPEIVSFRVKPIYEELTPDDEIYQVMKDAYFTLYEQYNDSIPTYNQPDSCPKELYTVRAEWKSIDWWPGVDELYVEIKYLNEHVVGRRTMSKSDGYKFLNYARSPGSSFGEGYNDTTSLNTHVRLSDASISNKSSDLRHRL